MMCKCRSCGAHFHSSIIISDTVWEKLRKELEIKESDPRIVCGVCIAKTIESLKLPGHFFLYQTEDL